MTRIPALIAASLLTLSAFTPVSAASRDEQTKACRGDAMHFCSAEIPDTDKITACMKQHISELSPECRAMFNDGKKSGAKAGSSSGSS